MTEFGRHIHDLRVRNGMSAADLADRLGVTPQRVNALERNEDAPAWPLARWEAVAGALGTSMEDLLCAAGYLDYNPMDILVDFAVKRDAARREVKELREAVGRIVAQVEELERRLE